MSVKSTKNDEIDEAIVKLIRIDEGPKSAVTIREHGETKVSLLRKLPKFRSTVTPNLRKRFRKLNCFKTEEEDIPMMDIPRHKSIDINVGLARRASLFLFRRKSVCVHPYHPYTPKQTSRRIYIGTEEK